MEEKRNTPRMPYALSFPFDSLTAGTKLLKNRRFAGTGVDISDLGIGAFMDRRLAEGEVVKLILPVLAAKAALPVLAVVVWSRFQDGCCRAGLRFLA